MDRANDLPASQMGAKAALLGRKLVSHNARPGHGRVRAVCWNLPLGVRTASMGEKATSSGQQLSFSEFGVVYAWVLAE